MKLTKVFYDGKCGLCSKEINYYKRVAPQNIFEWHDIASNPKILREINISQYDALMFLHATDQESNLKIGVDAFILIWGHLRYWKILSILVRTPIIYSIAKITYKLFANYRFKKLTHCQMASQKVT
tara:strand:- start:84 stop:461 length:378 start_codon:yes stop_codon:yes gene_type:complete